MYIHANGIRIHYEMEGAPSEPVITLSHSLATNLSIWDPQMEMLLHSYRVLRYDTRGHGKTEIPEGPYTLELLAGDIRALLQTLEIEKTLFMGISMGGMIGQQLALQSPELISTLILCDTSSQIPQEAWPIWDERMRVAEKNGMEPHVQPTLERWFTPAYRDRHPEVMERIGAMIRSTDPGGYVGCSYAIRGLDLAEQIQNIKVPTLVLVGEEDLGTPLSAAQAIRERIENSVLVVLKSASHLSNIEQSKAFNEAVSTFLLRNKS